MRRSDSLSLPLFPVDGVPASTPGSASLALVAAPSAPASPPPPSSTRLVELEDLVARVNDYATNVRADTTRRGYEGNFRAFAAWCAECALDALPATPATVAAYLAALAGQGRRPSTIGRALAGIACVHRERGCLWPRSALLTDVMRGIRRRHGVAPAQKAALDDEDLAAMVAVLGGELADLRDRALLTLGWLGAFRRSELVALEVSDVTRTAEGLLVRVRRAKADQEGRGGNKAIPYASRPSLCPVRALEAWLGAAGIASGPIFRAVDRGGRVHTSALSDRSVARIVQRVAAAAGRDPATVAGHSLRAGFITTAARRGKRLDEIMRQTHQKSERVVRGYIRSASVFENNAAVGLV
jgi:integrase